MQSLYHGLTKRTSTLVLAIGVGAFGFERGFDIGTTWIWENANKGKLWKDIAHKYVMKEEDDDFVIVYFDRSNFSLNRTLSDKHVSRSVLTNLIL